MKKQEWINLLINNGGSVEELEKVQVNSKTELFGLCKYKKILRERGRGKIEFAEVETEYNVGNITNLQSLLNKLFLEFYTESEIENLLKLMKETRTSIKQIYDRHIQNPEATLLSHLSL